MPDWMNKVLLFGAIEAVHFLLFTLLLVALGFLGADGLSKYADMLRYGIVDFWLGWPGQLILLCLAAVIVWCLWELIAGWLALKKRSERLDQEVKEKVEAKLAVLAVRQEEFILKKVLDGYGWQKDTLEADRVKLEREQRTLVREKEYMVLQYKTVETYKDEMQAIRKKAAEAKERQAEVRNNIRWAQEALSADEPNIGLAVRLLRKAFKG